MLTADDAGAAAAVDDAVSHLLELERLDRVAVFANFARVETARRWRQQGAAIGIHLNMSTGPPLLSAQEIPSLVDSETGSFHDPRDLPGSDATDLVSQYAAALPQRVLAEELRAEWAAQCDRLHTLLGREPAFVSVHHDLDRVPVVAAVADSLVRGKRCRQSLRMSGELSGYDYRLHPPTATSEEVRDFFTAALTLAAEDAAQGREFEVVCHPAKQAHGLSSFTMYKAPRVVEYHALLDERVGDLVARARAPGRSQ